MPKSVKPVKKKKQPAARRNFAFWLTEIIASAMFVAGFFVPPMGVVDGSVLTGMGILLGFGGVSMLPDIVAAGHSATVTLPGGSSVEVKRDTAAESSET